MTRPGRMICALAGLLLTAAVGAGCHACSADPGIVRDSAQALDETGQSWRVVIAGGTHDSAGVLRSAVLSVRDTTGRPVWAQFPAILHPWTVRAGRFAGRDVVLIGVRKTAAFDPVERPRPFLYSILPGGTGLRKVWLGTSLSRPFTAADLANLDGSGEDELVAVESTQSGGWELAAYRWRGFGIEGIARSGELRQPVEMRCADVWPGGGEEVVTLHLEGSLWRFDAFALKSESIVSVARAWATVKTGGVQWGVAGGECGRPGSVRLSRRDFTRTLPFRAPGDP